MVFERTMAQIYSMRMSKNSVAESTVAAGELPIASKPMGARRAQRVRA
jgi:hypothetical protein